VFGEVCVDVLWRITGVLAWRGVAWRTWTWNLDLRLTADRTTTTTIRVVKQTTA